MDQIYIVLVAGSVLQAESVVLMFLFSVVAGSVFFAASVTTAASVILNQAILIL